MYFEFYKWSDLTERDIEREIAKRKESRKSKTRVYTTRRSAGNGLIVNISSTGAYFHGEIQNIVDWKKTNTGLIAIHPDSHLRKKFLYSVVGKFNPKPKQENEITLEEARYKWGEMKTELYFKLKNYIIGFEKDMIYLPEEEELEKKPENIFA